MLSIRNLTVSRGGKILIDRFNLDLNSGELAGITGPSGCGKTTLLRTISGLITPPAGNILLDGKPVWSHGWTNFRRLVTYLNQTPVLLNNTVEFNLSQPFRYSISKSTYFDKQKAEELMLKVGLESEVLTQQTSTLSVGQKQRVCLVRALLVQPRVLLLDEPTSSLDEAATAAVEDLLIRLAKDRGTSAVVVCHDNLQANRLCSRIVNLQNFIVQ